MHRGLLDHIAAAVRRAPGVGTVFHERLANGEMKRSTKMRFARNSGYACAVGDDTWHSVDLVGPEVSTRDSILLTYFLDAGPLRPLRNRSKRLGTPLRNELRYIGLGAA